MVLWLIPVASDAGTAPALTLHLEAETLGAGCTRTQTLRCQTIQVEGTPLTRQRAYVVASHVPSIAGIEFGIAYAPEILIESWTPCADGLAIADSHWPQSGTGIALTWDDPVEPTWDDSTVVVGYFTLADESVGVLAVTPHLGSGRAAYVDKAFVTYEFEPATLGRADVAGTGLGHNTCGVLDMPSLFPTHAPEIIDGEPARRLVTTCEYFGLPPNAALWSERVSVSASTDELPHAVTTVSDALGQDEPVAYTIGVKQPASAPRGRVGVVRRKADGLGRYAERLDASGDPQLPVQNYLPRRKFLVADRDRLFVAAENQTLTGTRIAVSRRRSNDLEASWTATYHNNHVDGDDFLGGIVVHDGDVFLAGWAESSSDKSPFVVKLDGATGDTLATTTLTAFPGFGGLKYDVADLALSPSGDVLAVVGNRLDDATTGRHTYLLLLLSTDDLSISGESSQYGNAEHSLQARAVGTFEDKLVISGETVRVSAPSKQFVFLHQRTGGDDTFYDGEDGPFTRYIDAGTNARFLDLAVLEFAIALVAVEREPGIEDRVAVGLLDGPDIAWEHTVTCQDLHGVRGGALASLPDEQRAFLTVGMKAPLVDDACRAHPCTWAFEFDLSDFGGGEIVNGHLAFGQTVEHRPEAMTVVGSSARSYVASVARGSFDDLGVTAFSFGQVVGVETTSSGVASPSLSVTAAAAGSLHFTLEGGWNSQARIGVYDVTGRLVADLRLDSERAGVVPSLGSGVYFVEADDGVSRATARAVLVR